MEYMTSYSQQSKLQAVGVRCLAKMNHLNQVNISRQMEAFNSRILAHYVGTLSPKTIASGSGKQFGPCLFTQNLCGEVNLSIVDAEKALGVPAHCIEANLEAKHEALGNMLEGLIVMHLTAFKDFNNWQKFAESDYRYMTNAVINRILQRNLGTNIPSDVIKAVKLDNEMLSFLDKKSITVKTDFESLFTSEEGNAHLENFLLGRAVGKQSQKVDKIRRIFHLLALIRHFEMDGEKLETALAWLYKQTGDDQENGVLVHQTIDQLMILPARERWLPELLVKTYLEHPGNGLDNEGKRYFSHLQLKRSCPEEEIKSLKRSILIGQDHFKNSYESKCFKNEVNESRWELLAMYQLQLAGRLENSVYNQRTSSQRYDSDRQPFRRENQKPFFDINFTYDAIEQESIEQAIETSPFKERAMEFFKPEYWSKLHQEQQAVDNFDCQLLLDEELLDEIYSADFPSFADLSDRLFETELYLGCSRSFLANWYLHRAAETRATTLKAVGLLAHGHISHLIPVAEAFLRTFANGYSLHTIRNACDEDLQSVIFQVQFLLVQWCDQKTAQNIVGQEWLGGAISSFLLLSNDRYLPPSVMGLVEEVAKESKRWKAVLQLYQHMFSIQTTDCLTRRLDD
jgi:hypothetical protein